ncbi:hypothetical protein NDU88_000456 [Pleurodeles waltl]|uniref:Uncharacterized protein n=1 Tax=Pleurodeles waltl TaxID=8319 RepID=A0AAV7SX99_PLEWA|nr:hypothetical protein NDU88_000456 [Pleurodeles waltl]
MAELHDGEPQQVPGEEPGARAAPEGSHRGLGGHCCGWKKETDRTTYNDDEQDSSTTEANQRKIELRNSTRWLLRVSSTDSLQEGDSTGY